MGFLIAYLLIGIIFFTWIFIEHVEEYGFDWRDLSILWVLPVSLIGWALVWPALIPLVMEEEQYRSGGFVNK